MVRRGDHCRENCSGELINGRVVTKVLVVKQVIVSTLRRSSQKVSPALSTTHEFYADTNKEVTAVSQD